MRTSSSSFVEFAAVGPRGEPVDLWRTFVSHGVASLPPMRVDEDARTLEATLALPRGRPRTVLIRQSAAGRGAIEIAGRPPSPSGVRSVVAAVRHVLSLDLDLSGFYAVAASDPDLAWAAGGAGRMIRSQTVFEEVVKTICTTNCAWSATERMVGALVEHLGEPAIDAPRAGARGRAFPSAAAMANADEAFYRDVVRAGYRGTYMKELAAAAADGSLDLEALGRAPADAVSDDELAAALLALPGVGPYAAAHIMMMLGRYSRLILDSWTRPKYARVAGKKVVTDRAIQRRFRRYGPYAGLAFWLFCTRDWVDEPPPAP